MPNGILNSFSTSLYPAPPWFFPHLRNVNSTGLVPYVQNWGPSLTLLYLSYPLSNQTPNPVSYSFKLYPKSDHLPPTLPPSWSKQPSSLAWISYTPLTDLSASVLTAAIFSAAARGILLKHRPDSVIPLLKIF